MDTWKVGPVELKSRLILGSGKYKDFGVMREAIAAAKAEVVTVSVRRVELKAPGHVGLLEALEGVRLLPNTAGARTAEEAVRLARLGRLLTGERWVKLEVIPDPTYLLPDPLETLKAAENLGEKPWYAIGGIDLGNLDQVLEAGARRIVVVRAILDAPDPERAARALRERLYGVA